MTKRVKIAYIITKGDIGGAQKYVSQLLKKVDEERFEKIAITGEEGGSLKANRKLKWLSNKSHFLFLGDLMAVWELKKVLQEEKPDVIHLNSSKAGVIGALAGKWAGVPKIIFTAHGWVFGDESLPWIKRQLYIWAHKIAGRYQDVIINVSKNDLGLAKRFKIAPENKMVVIENGVEIKELDKVFKERSEIREKWQRGNKKEIWIGSIGRLVKEKNYNLLIEVAREKTENIQWIIMMTDGSEKERLENKIKEYNLENDFLLIKSNEASADLKGLDIFVLPSIKEGMPFTVIEAMMAGVPVITSKVGGMTEMIGENRGWLFESRNKADLLEKIREVIDNKEEAQKRVKRARKWAEENFNLEDKVKEIEVIYEKESFNI